MKFESGCGGYDLSRDRQHERKGLTHVNEIHIGILIHAGLSGLRINVTG